MQGLKEQNKSMSSIVPSLRLYFILSIFLENIKSKLIVSLMLNLIEFLNQLSY